MVNQITGFCCLVVSMSPDLRGCADTLAEFIQEIDASAELVAIHDSARPLVTATDTLQCFEDALEVRACGRAAPQIVNAYIWPHVHVATPRSACQAAFAANL